ARKNPRDHATAGDHVRRYRQVKRRADASADLHATTRDHLARPVELHAHQTILVDHATPDVAVLKRILCAARRVTLGDTLADLADRAELLARDAADYLGTLNRHLRNVDLRTRLPCQAHRLTTCLSCLE